VAFWHLAAALPGRIGQWAVNLVSSAGGPGTGISNIKGEKIKGVDKEGILNIGKLFQLTAAGSSVQAPQWNKKMITTCSDLENSLLAAWVRR
jgi:hypothetical protein